LQTNYLKIWHALRFIEKEFSWHVRRYGENRRKYIPSNHHQLQDENRFCFRAWRLPGRLGWATEAGNDWRNSAFW